MILLVSKAASSQAMMVKIGVLSIICSIFVAPVLSVSDDGALNFNHNFDATDVTTLYTPLQYSSGMRNRFVQTQYKDTLYADADVKSAEYLNGLAQSYRETFAKINPDVYEVGIDNANLLFRAAVLSVKPHAPDFIKQAAQDFEIWHDSIHKPVRGDKRSAGDKLLLFSINGLLSNASPAHKELQRLFKEYFVNAVGHKL